MFIDTTPAAHTFFELNEQAREAALHAVVRAHDTTRDPDEPDRLATALVAAMATALGHPGRGCRELEVTVWDDARAGHWSLAGTLYPATAPALRGRRASTPSASPGTAASTSTPTGDPPPPRWRRCAPPYRNPSPTHGIPHTSRWLSGRHSSGSPHADPGSLQPARWRHPAGP